MAGAHTQHHLTQEMKEEIAKEKFQCAYDSLDTNQKKAVGSIGKSRMVAQEREGGEGEAEHQEPAAAEHQEPEHRGKGHHGKAKASERKS